MSYKIVSIEGIGAVYGETLAKAGVATTNDLIERCAGRTGRTKLEEETGISAGTLLKWTNMADLMRISGVGPQFAELLEASGVDTIKELRNRNGENLAETMRRVNAEKNLSRSVPATSIVEGWIEQAKTMDGAISY